MVMRDPSDPYEAGESVSRFAAGKIPSVVFLAYMAKLGVIRREEVLHRMPRAAVVITTEDGTKIVITETGEVLP
jgi:hypothetical protein